jgi:hypothetical protein
MEMGYHLNFRDPDNIALEFSVPNELLLTAQRLMAAGNLTKTDIAAFVSQHINPDFAPRVAMDK